MNEEVNEEAVDLEELAELREQKEQWLRARADLENMRRRYERERQEFVKSANMRMIEALLPVLDNLKMGLELAHKHPDAGSLTHGFDLVHTHLKGLLTQEGLEAIAPQVGAVFDASEQECVSYAPDANVPVDHISALLRTGYKLHGLMLRPALVVVSKGP